jgi:hypothetical protein
MIFGAHGIVYSAGHGWPIFALPHAELAQAT